MENILTTARTYLPLARPYLPHAAALLLFAVLGWADGYFHSIRTVDNPHLKETWSLPEWAPFRAGPEKAKLVTLDIWDGQKNRAAAAKAAPQSQKTWRLVGTVRNGKAYAAVIQLDGTKIQRALAGDTLPNGEKVLEVESGVMRIDLSGTPQEIKLFQQGKK